MAEQPRFINRFLALIQGEVPADTLEAYQRAGNAVYDLLKQVEDHRLSLKIQGLNPWQFDTATQTQFLCAWNAFVLQSVGDQLLQADYRADPATIGYVPPMTAEQALNFYNQVGKWLSRAHQASNNPTYRLDVPLPADLPVWGEEKPCPNSHLDGMISATKLIRTHTEAAIAGFESDTIASEHQTALNQIHQLLASATSEAEYAEQLWAPRLAQVVHEKVEQHARTALEQYYRLGQILAMPQLLDRKHSTQTSKTAFSDQASRLPLPGEAGFDRWCLTDPVVRDDPNRPSDTEAAIALIWKYDPDPEKTLAIQSEINGALERRDIDYATDRFGDRLGHYYCCPWAPIYVVKHPVTIANRHLCTFQEFTLEISAEAVPKGGEFQRKLLVGSFQPVEDMEYCSPFSSDRRRSSHHRRGC